jgi:hypothetical protein
MFIIFGPILALYQNQQEPQPRERDYFYVGAFYVFSLWIAMGVVALVEYVRKYLKSGRLLEGGTIAVVAVFAVAIPGRMLQMNWREHDRSGNYVAWDYSYNILQTCEKDAILFTNGDNDTFPLWYLQDVEGIRRDVRIVNLSLVNTSWYIQQMKNRPYYAEAQAVPISFTDAQIANINPIAWEPRIIDLPVTKEAIAKYGADSTVVAQGKITFRMMNTLQFGTTKAIRTQDIMVRNIITTNQWKRPIYFAVTCAPDSKIGLDDYLWFHGLAWRLEPRKVSSEDLGLNKDILEKNLFDEPEGFSKSPLYGYKFRNIGNPKVYFDENVTRLMLNYRSAFIRLAMYYANMQNNIAKGAEILDRMEKVIPRAKVPMEWRLESDMANFYHRIGRDDKFEEYARDIEEPLQQMIDAGHVNMNTYYNPYRALLDIYDVRKDYPKALDILRKLELMYPNDDGLKKRIATVESLMTQHGTGVRDSVKN